MSQAPWEAALGQGPNAQFVSGQGEHVLWGWGQGRWGGAWVLTFAMAPAAKGHPSDDHKECHGCRGHSSHNPYSGEQVCREKREHSEEAELKTEKELGKRDLGLGLGSLGSKGCQTWATQGLWSPSLGSWT